MVRFINLLLTIHYICFHLVTSLWKKPVLGYDKDFKINEEQAATVRLIYWLFISGLSLYAITKELESRGIKSPSGKDRWHISTVKSILTNENTVGMHSSRSSTLRTSCRRRERPITAKSPSIMWRNTMRPLFPLPSLILCRLNLPAGNRMVVTAE